MRGRKPDKFELKPKDRTPLYQLLRNGQTSLQIARRAQILLGRADDQKRVGLLGEMVRQDPSTIWRVCDRYRRYGLQAALYDAARSGRPPIFSPKRMQKD